MGMPMPKNKSRDKVMNRSLRGFTVIELMIVVLIMGLLAAIASAFFTDQVNRGKRVDGKDILLDLASAQEAFYSANFSYANSITVADQLGRADTNSLRGDYTVALAVQPAGCAAGVTACRTYTLTATSTFVDPECTTLTLDSFGARGNTGTGSVDDCWR